MYATFATTNSSAEATNQYLHIKYKHKQFKRFQRGETRFSSATKNSSPCRCSSRATDKPNVAVNTCQNNSSGTEFAIAKMSCEYAY